MKISVIAIFYNAQSTVDRCVHSILSQQLPPEWSLELIAVDDCSQDQTKSLLTAMKDPRLKTVFHSENKGISGARNSGMRQVSGDCFFFIDGDDYLPESSLSVLASLWLPDLDWVQGSYRMVDELGIEKSIQSRPDSCCMSHSEVENHFNDLEFVYPHNRLINKKFKERYFPEGMVHEDRFWNVEIFPEVERLVTTSFPTYNYVVSGSSFSSRSRSSQKYMESAIELMRRMLALPSCWSVVRETFLLTTIYKNLYLYGDCKMRKQCWSLLDPRYKVSIPINPPFPRFPATIYRFLQSGVPDVFIKALAYAYASLHHILGKPV